MKKILFLLLFTVSIYGQTLQNPTFGIVTEKTNATDNTPAYFTTSQVDGVHKKTPAALIAFKSDLPVSCAIIVYVNDISPSTATIFDDENPPTTNDNALKIDTDNLYIGTDASTWVYNGTTYITKTIAPSSNFKIVGTGVDAGSNKTSDITREGSISSEGNISTELGFYINRNGSNTPQIGGFMNFSNAIASNIMMFQLNASNGLDLWNYASGTWNKRFTFSSGGDLTLHTAPTTSAGTYDILTRNISTGVVEKVTSASVATTASPTFTGTVVLPSTTSIGTVTNTELSYVDGVTSSIQTQLNGKQSTLTNPVTGTGTTNYIAKFTGSGTIGNSQIIDNGTNVLIGTTTDNGVDKLQVNGSALLGSATRIGNSSDGFIRLSGGTLESLNAASTDYSKITFLASEYDFTFSGASKMYLKPSGNLLIGTTTDNGVDKLQVNGSISATNYTGSATLTGTPTAPTATAGTNTTQIATTAFVMANGSSSSATFTPTAVSGITFSRCYWIKNGNVLDVVYNFSITGNTSYSATMTLPNSFTINANSNGREIGGGKITTNSGYSRVQETATSSDVYLSITSENTGTASGFARASILIN